MELCPSIDYRSRDSKKKRVDKYMHDFVVISYVGYHTEHWTTCCHHEPSSTASLPVFFLFPFFYDIIEIEWILDMIS